MSEPARVHDHPVLGTVVFEPSLCWWKTRSPVPLGDSDQVSLTVSVSDEGDPPVDRFDQAASTLRRLDPRDLRRVVAECYLELYNDTWCQDDDEELDQDGFCARIRPVAVDVHEDGIELYFNDGGLFGEHSIVMYLDVELQLVDVKLAG